MQTDVRRVLRNLPCLQAEPELPQRFVDLLEELDRAAPAREDQ